MADTAGGGRPRPQRDPWLLDSDSSSARGGEKGGKEKALNARIEGFGANRGRPTALELHVIVNRALLRSIYRITYKPRFTSVDLPDCV